MGTRGGPSLGLGCLVVLLFSPAARAQLPDLTADIFSVAIQVGATVRAGDVAEGCAHSTSGVDLLRFGVRTHNLGDVPFVLGDPQCQLPCSEHPDEPCGNPDFICSPADGHNHGHYTNYVRYELVDTANQAVVVGRKQGFCLRDTDCASPVYTCGNQGISAGCADTYGPSLGCQYLDISGVPPGDYVLRVTVDPAGRITEGNEDNNVTERAVTIPGRRPSTTTTTASPATTTTIPGTTTTTTPGPTTTTEPGATTTTVTVPPTTTEPPTTTTTVTIPPSSTTTTTPGTPPTTLPTSSGATTRVSVDETGKEASGPSLHPSLSKDGRFVCFESRAAGLVAKDTNRFSDVFLQDRATGAMELVSVAADGSQARGGSELPDVSGDGRFVVFTTNAPNLVPDDTNRTSDVFVRDRVAGTTVRASIATSGLEGDDESFGGVISADGRYVAFASNATTLESIDVNGVDIFVRDLQQEVTYQVSIASDGSHGDADSANPAISSNGRLVAFESQATNLVGGDTNGATDVFVHDHSTLTTTRVSVASDGTEANGDSFRPALSADGNIVVFESRASNLVPDDNNGVADIFVHDLTTGATVRVSVAADGAEGNGASFLAGASGDGRMVVFSSEADNLVPDDTNGTPDVFLHDRMLGTTIRVSLASDGTQADGQSLGRALSFDGNLVGFESEATNLVPGDANGVVDVFVRARGAPVVACSADADCDDTNMCSADRCASGQCTSVDIGGLEGVFCRLKAGIDGTVCGKERVPRRYKRMVRRTLHAVEKRLTKLEKHPPKKPSRLARALGRCDKRLARLDKRAAKMARHKKISSDCRDAIAQFLGQLRAAILVLRI